MRYKFRMTSTAAGAAYVAYGSRFDGTYWMERDAGLTGAADGTAGIFAAWIRFNGSDGVQQTFFDSNTRLTIQKRTTNLLRFVLRDSASATKIQIDQNAASFPAIVAATGWVHILASWSNAAVGAFAHLYINDTSCATATTLAGDGAALDYTDIDWAVGGVIGSTAVVADLSEVYFNIATSLNLTTESNRRLFTTAANRPVSLGDSGQTPTGSSPIVYLKNQFSSFTSNSGTGGNFVAKGTGSILDGGTV